METIQDLTKYRLFLRQKLYCKYEYMNLLIAIISKALDSNSVYYDYNSNSIRIKIKKSYMKKNGIDRNDIKYYYHDMGNIFYEFITNGNIDDLFISLYHNDRSFSEDFTILQKIKQLDPVSLNKMITAVCVENNYIIIYL